jgi:hypothetical protein
MSGRERRTVNTVTEVPERGRDLQSDGSACEPSEGTEFKEGGKHFGDLESTRRVEEAKGRSMRREAGVEGKRKTRKKEGKKGEKGGRKIAALPAPAGMRSTSTLPIVRARKSSRPAKTPPSFCRTFEETKGEGEEGRGRFHVRERGRGEEEATGCREDDCSSLQFQGGGGEERGGKKSIDRQEVVTTSRKRHVKTRRCLLKVPTVLLDIFIESLGSQRDRRGTAALFPLLPSFRLIAARLFFLRSCLLSERTPWLILEGLHEADRGLEV